MSDSISNPIKVKQVPYQERPDLAFQARVVKVYDSSPIISFNAMAKMFHRTPQRLQQIHKKYPHDCPRKKLEELK